MKNYPWGFGFQLCTTKNNSQFLLRFGKTMTVAKTNAEAPQNRQEQTVNCFSWKRISKVVSKKRVSWKATSGRTSGQASGRRTVVARTVVGGARVVSGAEKKIIWSRRPRLAASIKCDERPFRGVGLGFAPPDKSAPQPKPKIFRNVPPEAQVKNNRDFII